MLEQCRRNAKAPLLIPCRGGRGKQWYLTHWVSVLFAYTVHIRTLFLGNSARFIKQSKVLWSHSLLVRLVFLHGTKLIVSSLICDYLCVHRNWQYYQETEGVKIGKLGDPESRPRVPCLKVRDCDLNDFILSKETQLSLYSPQTIRTFMLEAWTLVLTAATWSETSAFFLRLCLCSVRTLLTKAWSAR